MQLCKDVKQKKHAIAANLTIDLMHPHVIRGKRAIILTPREFLLLDFFARFFRAEAAAGTHGHGLGLSIARELALAQGGDALYRRFVSGWTHFTLEFPVG